LSTVAYRTRTWHQLQRAGVTQADTSFTIGRSISYSGSPYVAGDDLPGGLTTNQLRGWYERRWIERKGSTGISYVSSGINCRDDAASTLTVTVSIAAHNTAVLAFASDDPTARVTQINGGGRWSRVVDPTSVGNETIEMWVTVCEESTVASSVVITFTSDDTINPYSYYASVVQLSGALRASKRSTASGSGANPSISITTQDDDNWVVAAFHTAGQAAISAGTGTLRQNSAACTSGSLAFTTNTSVSAGAVVNSLTHTTDDWIGVALELRTI